MAPAQQQAEASDLKYLSCRNQQTTRPQTKHLVMPHSVLETNLPEANLDQLQKKKLWFMSCVINLYNWDDLSTKMQDVRIVRTHQSKNVLLLPSVPHAFNLPSHYLNRATKATLMNRLAKGYINSTKICKSKTWNILQLQLLELWCLRYGNKQNRLQTDVLFLHCKLTKGFQCCLSYICYHSSIYKWLLDTFKKWS